MNELKRALFLLVGGWFLLLPPSRRGYGLNGYGGDWNAFEGTIFREGGTAVTLTDEIIK